MFRVSLLFLTVLVLFSSEGKAEGPALRKGMDNNDPVLVMDVQTDEPAQYKELHPFFAEPEFGRLVEAVDALKKEIGDLKRRVAMLEKKPQKSQ